MSIVPSISEPQRPTPRWQDWVEKNARPKNDIYTRVRREPTRWQKRGPMSRRDWVRFYHWAAKNALPREINDAKPPPCPPPKRRPPKKINWYEIMRRLAKLSEPRPRKVRDKYKYPPKPIYAYSPKIYYRKPPHRDSGRPFASPKVPKCFPHIELEIDFWNNIRFPVRRAALKYLPNATMCRLAMPKRTPPLKQHCPIPEKPKESIPPRRRMTYWQWIEHQRRLEYLAKPVVRPFYDHYC